MVYMLSFWPDIGSSLEFTIVNASMAIKALMGVLFPETNAVHANAFRRIACSRLLGIRSRASDL